MFFKLKKAEEQIVEKRSVPRTGFFQSSYFLPVTDNSDTFECWFKDISQGGVSFQTRTDRLKEGDEIKILYKIGTKLRNDKMSIRSARKVYDNYRYGCAFIDPDEGRSFIINEYCSINRNNTGE